MGKKRTKKQKNNDLRRRYDAIKNLMSTFAMSTVAVVAIVTLVPTSPKAEILKSTALSQEIVYQVMVTDEDNALDLDTLVVVLENQFEHHEQPITLGANSGYFTDLQSDTQYRLSVYGSKGFGQERLDTLFIRTKDKIGATILEVSSSSDIHPTYTVDVSINDPQNEFTSFTLFYGTKWEENEEYQYNSVPLTMDFESIELSGIYTSYPIHIYLEGTTQEDIELLDEIYEYPPFEYYGSIDFAYYNDHQIAFYAYGDNETVNQTFKMNVYKNNRLLSDYEYTPGNDYHDYEPWVIDFFEENTTYVFECVATYTNPITLRKEEVIIYEGEHSTTKSYDVTYQLELIESEYRVSLQINDPLNLVNHMNFEIYDTSGDYTYLVQSTPVLFEVIDNGKTLNYAIPVPSLESYKILITIKNDMDYSFNENIDTIVID